MLSKICRPKCGNSFFSHLIEKIKMFHVREGRTKERLFITKQTYVPKRKEMETHNYYIFNIKILMARFNVEVLERLL